MGIEQRCKEDSHTTGKDWLSEFLQCHLELSIREAKGKCNKRKHTKDSEFKSKKTTTRNKSAKKAKNNLFKSDDEDSSRDQIVERTICNDESEYSEEETLCTICLDTGKVGKCGTDAEVAETGPMKHVLEVIVQLLIFVPFVSIRKIWVICSFSIILSLLFFFLFKK